VRDQLLIRSQAELFALRAAVKAIIGHSIAMQSDVVRATREDVMVALDLAIDDSQDGEIGTMFRNAVREALDELLPY
jgi:hypothetical protein